MIAPEHYDVVIVGGSLGGVAAAHQAAVQGLQVILLTPYEWIGGQVTTQGVTPLDEHAYIEQFGGTYHYHHFLRVLPRQHYQKAYNAPDTMSQSVLGSNLPLNPGNGWVSRLCYTPQVALDCLPDNFEVWHGYRLTAVDDDTLTFQHTDGQTLMLRATYIVDATDTGEVLPLANIPYVTGAEAQADTGEPSAPPDPRPQEMQGFTFPFAVEFCPGEDHTIPAPEGCANFVTEQPYTLQPIGRDGKPAVYKMFDVSESGNLPFWSYRRIHDGALLGGNDVSLINWISNDYYGGSIIDVPLDDHNKHLDEGKRLSLGFLHWLQTACPRDDGGVGYKELKLRPDVMGTADGLSQQPYIRESRRIVPRTRIVEQDIAAAHQTGARAKHYRDSVGIGWYAMDLHPCVGNPTVSMYALTRPYQIPLGALLPDSPAQVIAGCKNIGTTHLTNGAYRLQPTEWAIGEATGLLTAFCVQMRVRPYDLLTDDWLLWQFQYQLVTAGVPVFWAIDVPYYEAITDLFIVTQLLLVRGILRDGSRRWGQLTIEPDTPLTDDFDIKRLQTIAQVINAKGTFSEIHMAAITPHITWRETCNLFSGGLRAALHPEGEA